jgi:ribosomal protein L16 Arg81 hydroxylase
MTMLADQGKAAAERPCPELSRLLHPIDLALFWREYWERRPLLVQRNDPGYHADLLTLDDVDRLLSLSGVQLDNLRVVVDGKETNVSELHSVAGVNSLEALYEHYRNGSTITMNSIDGRFEPLQRLSRALSAEASARFQMNVYVTPAGNRGFKAHYDTHDVFVLQAHGTKRWRLASQPYQLPLAGRPYDKSQPEPEPEQEFDLHAGDMLYLPRGTVHSAAANDSVSVHITVGVHPVLWSDLIIGAVKKLFADDARFRTGLPIGFADDTAAQQAVEAMAGELMDALHADISPQALTDAAVERGISIGFPALRHHLTDLEEFDRISLLTRVHRRTQQRWIFTIDGDTVRLTFHNKKAEFPGTVADEVRYAAESGEAGFTGNDIPGDLDESGRLFLIKTLVREGFLTLSK